MDLIDMIKEQRGNNLIDEFGFLLNFGHLIKK